MVKKLRLLQHLGGIRRGRRTRRYPVVLKIGPDLSGLQLQRFALSLTHAGP
jgi:hypothetical protein